MKYQIGIYSSIYHPIFFVLFKSEIINMLKIEIVATY